MKNILIRAEDKNAWERRAPIVPEDLKKIVQKTGAKAYVQKSEKRIYNEEDYQNAGAGICDGIEVGEVIFGVKEIPKEIILDNKVYIFFSHTTKGQSSGMPLLQKIMDSGSTLIDYEKITNAGNQRQIYFGSYAGDAGAIDILSLMGEHWAHRNIHTPFEEVKRAHQYTSIADAKQHMLKIKDRINAEGLPSSLTPFVIGVLGYGNVAKGAHDIFDCLPIQHIQPNQLASFVQSNDWNTNTIYISVFKEEDLVTSVDGSAFDLQEYYKSPEKYESKFNDFLPHITILVNAVYWDKQYPQFVTWDGLQALNNGSNPGKLQGIADISGDTCGAVECTVKSTDSDNPTFLCHPKTRTTTDGLLGDGIVLLAVDNLPCELPKDSSDFFSNQLLDYIPNILNANYDRPLDMSGLSQEVEKAVIVYNGKLTSRFEYLSKYL